MSKVSKRMRDTVSSHQQDVMDASLSQREDGQGKTEEASTSSLNINNYEDKDGDDDGNTGLLITETIVCFQKAFYQKAKEALRRIFKLEWRKIWHLEHYAVSSMTVINNVKITTLLCCSGFSFNEGLVLMRPMDSNPAFVLLNLLAIIAFELHELVIAKSFFEHLEEIIDENDHQWKNELIAVKCNMGCFFINCGQYDRALRYFEKAAEISKEQLFYLAGIRNNVGQTYQVIGNYGDAERCFKDTLNILQHDEDSMNKTILLATKHNLARLYKQQERPDHALLELRQALNLCKEDHAVPRPFQGVLAAELLSLSLSQGERKENVPLQKYCVDLQSNIMSKDGGNIVDKADVAFLEAYAKVFLQRGEITAAKTMLYDFYLLFQNFHGQDHPYLIPLLYQLGYAYFTKNNYKQCAELMEKIENVAAETFGASNPKLLPIYSKLAELQFYHFKKEDLAKQYFEKVMKVLSCIKENGGSLLEKHLDHLKNIGILGSCVSLAVSDNYLILNLSRETLFKERRLHATKYNNAFEYCQKSEKQPIELFFRFGDSCVLMKNLTTLVNSLDRLDKNGVAVAALKSRLHHHQQPRQQQQKSLFVNHLKNKEILQVYQMISGLLKPRQSEHTGDYHCFDSLGKMIYYASADIFARNRTVSCDVLVMEENPNSVAQDHSKAAKQNISVVVVERGCVQPKFNVIASSVKPVDINDLRKLKDRSFECIKQTLEIVESSQQGRFVVAVNQTVESESVQALCDDLGILPLLVHELIKPDASFEEAKTIQKLPSKSVVQIQGKFPGVFLHKLLITCFNEKEPLGEVCDFVESKKTVSFLSIKPRKTHISASCKQGFIEIVINSLCSQASDESVCDCALNVIHITNIVEKCAHSFGIQLEQRYSQTSCRQTGECYLQQRRAGVLYHDAVAQGKFCVTSDDQQQPEFDDGDSPCFSVDAHQKPTSRGQSEVLQDGNVLDKLNGTFERNELSATNYSSTFDKEKGDLQSRTDVSTQTEGQGIPPCLEKKALEKVPERQRSWLENTESEKQVRVEFEQGNLVACQQANGAFERVSGGHGLPFRNVTNDTPDQELFLTNDGETDDCISCEDEQQTSLTTEESDYSFSDVTPKVRGENCQLFEEETASFVEQMKENNEFDSRSSDTNGTRYHIDMLDVPRVKPSRRRVFLQKAIQQACDETQKENQQVKEEKANLERLLGEALFERDQAVRRLRMQQELENIRRRQSATTETDVAMSSTRERQGSEDGRISEAERPGIGRNLSPVEDVREFEKRPSIGRGADSKIGKKNTETKSTNKSSDSDSSGDFGEDESACNTRYTLRQITDRDSLIDKSLKTSNDWKRNDVVSKANKSPGLGRHTAPDSDHQENQEFNNSEAETHGYRISFIKDETDEQTGSGLGALPRMSDYCTRNKPDQKLQTSFGEDVALSSDNHSCLKLVSFDTEGQSIEAELEIQNTGSRSECTGRDDESNLLSQSHRRESTDFPKMDTPLNKEDYSENDATDRVPVAAATHILPHGTSLPVGTALTNIKSTETLTTFKDFEDNQSVEQNQAREKKDQNERHHADKPDNTATFSAAVSNVPSLSWNNIESRNQPTNEVVTDAVRSRSVYLKQGTRPKLFPSRTISTQRAIEREETFVSGSPTNDGLNAGFLARHTRDASIPHFAYHMNGVSAIPTLPHENRASTTDVESESNVGFDNSFVLTARSQTQPIIVPNKRTTSSSDYSSQQMEQPAAYSSCSGYNVGPSYSDILPPPPFIEALPDSHIQSGLTFKVFPSSSMVNWSSGERNFGNNGALTTATYETNAHDEQDPDKKSESDIKLAESISCEETETETEDASIADEVEIAELENLSTSSVESFRSEEERVNTLEARVEEACAMVEQVFRERRAREQEIQEREQRQREERERALIERERRQREEQERIARDQEEREKLSEDPDRRQGNGEAGPGEATAATAGEVPSADDEKYPVQESPQWLCEHYQRRCNLRFPCCNVYHPCHRCHNSSDRCPNESAKAHEATHLQCIVCRSEQPVTESYDTQTCQSCGTKLAEYFCPKCKHFTGVEKKPYHCDKCGICRIHKDKSFHCEVCNVCLDKRLEGKHKCRPDSGHDECCICLEDAFSGCQILPCSHKVHRDCAIAMVRNGIRTCPVCRHPLYSADDQDD